MDRIVLGNIRHHWFDELARDELQAVLASDKITYNPCCGLVVDIADSNIYNAKIGSYVGNVTFQEAEIDDFLSTRGLTSAEIEFFKEHLANKEVSIEDIRNDHYWYNKTADQKKGVDTYFKNTVADYLSGTGYDKQLMKVAKYKVNFGTINLPMDEPNNLYDELSTLEGFDWEGNWSDLFLTATVNDDGTIDIEVTGGGVGGVRVGSRDAIYPGLKSFIETIEDKRMYSGKKTKGVDSYAEAYWSKVFEEMNIPRNILKGASTDIEELLNIEDGYTPAEYRKAYYDLASKYKDYGGLDFVRKVRSEVIKRRVVAFKEIEALKEGRL